MVHDLPPRVGTHTGYYYIAEQTLPMGESPSFDVSIEIQRKRMHKTEIEIKPR